MSEKPNPVTDAEIESIIAAIRAATGAGEGVTKSAAERVKLCIDAGARLTELKARMKHGLWQKWCDEIKTKIEAFNVSLRTLTKWMKLHRAAAEGRINANDAKSIRHAYQLAGIVPDSEDSKGNKPGEQETLYMIHLLRFAACIQRIDIDTMQQEERSTLRERLEPMHKLYVSLA